MPAGFGGSHPEPVTSENNCDLCMAQLPRRRADAGDAASIATGIPRLHLN
jgi:hypothetical protein